MYFNKQCLANNVNEQSKKWDEMIMWACVREIQLYFFHSSVHFNGVDASLFVYIIVWWFVLFFSVQTNINGIVNRRKEEEEETEP